ncbi:MAG: transketolase family protein [Lachnospiraceae bacterium]|nr:transketolase family protein [Lachnospiraceae bacterium]
MADYLTTREAYGEALAVLSDKYDYLVLDADLAKATQTARFKKKCPERFLDMGISEGDMMATAAGIATCGTTVFASTFALFAAGRAYEQIRNSIAYPHLHVIIGATHAGVMIGEDGASHQCIEDLALMRAVPGMQILVPCDEKSVFAAVEAAIKAEGPVYLRMGRSSCAPVYTEQPEVEIGKGIVLRDGTDVTIVAIGDMTAEAVKAAAQLAEEGISAAVIDMISVKPIDRELILKYLKTTGKIVTAEDHNIIGGLGSAVAEIVAEEGQGKLTRIGVRDTFGRSGKRGDLQQYFGLTAEKIAQACREMM